MRISFLGEGPQLPTGFGIVGRYLAREFARLGHQVFYLNWQHLGQPMTIFDTTDDLAAAIESNSAIGGYISYPGDTSQFCCGQYKDFIERSNPDIIFCLCDMHMEPMGFLAAQDWVRKYNWIQYVPIDGKPTSRRFYDLLLSPTQTVAMSKFGQKQLSKLGINVDYVWHGVDTEKFKPNPYYKKLTGYKDKFSVLFASRNQGRKEPTRVIQAAAKLKEERPDIYKNIIFHMHCDPNDPMGYDLKMIALDYGVTDVLNFTKQMRDFSTGINTNSLVRLFNCADVHLLPTSGEGFGLTTAETMSCGIPNLVTNYTTTKELLIEGNPGPRGFPIKVKDYIISARGTKRALADVDDIVDKLIFYYDNPDIRKQHGENARKFCEQNLDWRKHIVPKWMEIFGYDKDNNILLKEIT